MKREDAKVGLPTDDLSDFGLDSGEEDDSVFDAVSGESDGRPSADPCSLADLLAFCRRSRTAERGGPSAESPDPEPADPRDGDILERAGISRDVLAVTLEPLPEQVGMARIVPSPPDERPDRRRLGAAMLGIGGTLHRLYDGTPVSALDLEVGRGLAFGLACGAETIEVRVFAQFAAGAVVLQNRLMASAGRAVHQSSGGSARAAFDYMRAANQGLRLVQRTLEAVEVARHRHRDRTSIPLFKVGRASYGPDGGEGEKGMP